MWLNVTLILKFTLYQNVALFTERQHQEAGLWQSYKIVEVSKEITARHTSNWGGGGTTHERELLVPTYRKGLSKTPKTHAGTGLSMLVWLTDILYFWKGREAWLFRWKFTESLVFPFSAVYYIPHGDFYQPPDLVTVFVREKTWALHRLTGEARELELRPEDCTLGSTEAGMVL